LAGFDLKLGTGASRRTRVANGCREGVHERERFRSKSLIAVGMKPKDGKEANAERGKDIGLNTPGLKRRQQEKGEIRYNNDHQCFRCGEVYIEAGKVPFTLTPARTQTSALVC